MSPTTIAFVNDAGSAGKTTSAVAIAALLAQQGQRVLLVDLDKQANASYHLAVDPSTVTATIGSVLRRQAPLAETIVPTGVPGLDLVPAHEGLKADEIALQTKVGKELLLERALREVTHDVLLLDCQAGATDFWPLSALVAARWAITVTKPSLKELQGLPRVITTVEEVRDAYNPRLELGGIIPCEVPASTHGRAYTDGMQLLTESYDGLVTPPVRRNVDVASAYSYGEPITVFAPASPVSDDYRKVVGHLQGRGALPTPG